MQPPRYMLAVTLGVFGVLGSTSIAQEQATAPTISAYPEVFNFKGIHLGIPLSDFRRLPPVTEPLTNAALKDVRPVAVVCTGDVSEGDEQALDLRTSDTLKEIGATACVWARQRRGALAPEPIGAAGYGLGKYRFDFARPADGGEPRLYSIAFQPHPDSFSAIKGALTEQFGTPSYDQQEPLHDHFGVTFVNAAVAWENDTGTILAVKYVGSLSHSGLYFEHRDLAMRVDAYEKSHEPAKPKG